LILNAEIRVCDVNNADDMNGLTCVPQRLPNNATKTAAFCFVLATSRNNLFYFTAGGAQLHLTIRHTFFFTAQKP
jgi:hypothetical protein